MRRLHRVTVLFGLLNSFCLFGMLVLYQPVHAQFVDIGANLTGAGDSSLDLADYDRDGDLDLMIIGQASNGPIAHLYRNDNGAFSLVSNTPFIPVSLGEVAFADYDNDGDPDLVLTGQKSDGQPTTQIYRNDGGSFVDVNAGITALKASMVDWGDYDGDGDVDLFIAGVGTDNLTISRIFRNDGNNKFSDSGISLQGVRRGDATWLDIDLDGDPDLIISGRDTQNRRWTLVYSNNAGVMEESSYTLPAADLNVLAAGNYELSNSPQLLIAGTTEIGIRTRVFLPPDDFAHGLSDNYTEVETPLPDVEFAAASWADITNDLRAELALMGRDANGTPITRLFGWTHQAGFFELDASLEGLYKGDLAWADFDNDGTLDLAITGANVNDVPVTKIYRNASGIVNELPKAPLNGWVKRIGNDVEIRWGAGRDFADVFPGPGHVTYNLRLGTFPGGADIVSPLSNTDGTRRIARPGNAGKSLVRMLNDLPSGTYYWSVQSVDHGFRGSSFIPEQVFDIKDDGFEDTGIRFTGRDPFAFWGDLDNDGDLDVLTDSDLYENKNGAFSIRSSGVQFARELADYDNDGDLDVLTYDEPLSISDDPASALYRNDGWSFVKQETAFNPLYSFLNYAYDSANFGDLDNDGDLDLLATQENGIFDADLGSAIVYRNTNGAFSSDREEWGVLWYYGSPVIADYDNDGDLDFFTSGLDSDAFKGTGSLIHENTGEAFEIRRFDFQHVYNSSSAWADYDQDGDLDLANLGTIYGGLDPGINGNHAAVYRNEGQSFTRAAELLPPVSLGYATWADYDMDGDADLLLSGSAYLAPSLLFENRNGRFVNILNALDGLEFRHASWGDYDNDGDLDLLLSSEDENRNGITRLYRNTRSASNTRPTSPIGLSISVQDDEVTFSWQSATDQESASSGLTYNLRVGTSPGGSEIMSAPALEDGTLLSPVMGNVNMNTRWTLKGLPDQTYYWSVQAIDSGYMGSPFADEQTFQLPDGTIPVELISFDAIFTGPEIHLSWETASEINNARFEIQRAYDNEDFVTIGSVEGRGTTNEPTAYTFVDQHVAEYANRVSYRLRQIDFDGGWEYSPPAVVKRLPPAAVELFENYPDPFNPSTEIQFALPVGTQVLLAVYDMTGRRVATLVDGFRVAGRHRVMFKAEHLASGPYLYVLQTPTSLERRHMILLK